MAFFIDKAMDVVYTTITPLLNYLNVYTLKFGGKTYYETVLDLKSDFEK